MTYNDEDFFQRIDGLTPAGGIYSIVFFYDENGNPTSKDNAEKIQITEYDKDDNELRRTNLIRNTSKKDISK